MRKSTTAQDRLKYPNYFYNPYEKSLTRIGGTEPVSKMYTPHHFIRQQWRDNNPEKFKLVENQQKIFFLPTFVPKFNDMHSAVHNNTRTFESDWGFPREEFMFNEDSV